MGQISLPVINRSGLSMHWDSSGGSNHNNQNLYIKDYYVKELISLIYKSYAPFFNLSKSNVSLISGPYLLDMDLNITFNRTTDNKFNVIWTDKLCGNKITSYVTDCSDKFSELTEKNLPVYNGNTLLLKNNSEVIIVVKYFLVIRSNWNKQVKNYEHLMKTKMNSTKSNTYRKQLKRFRKTKNNKHLKEEQAIIN